MRSPVDVARVVGPHLLFFGTVLIVTVMPPLGIIPWALASAAFGEDRLETPAGPTGLGLLVLLSPTIVATVVYAIRPARDWVVRSISLDIAIALTAFITLATAWLSFATHDDSDGANIGGGFLVLFGIPLAAFAVLRLLFHAARRSRR